MPGVAIYWSTSGDAYWSVGESEWFGFYKPGQDKEVQLLEETSLYINDTIGIRKLKQQGKVTFLEVPGDHLQFTDAWFIENIIPFLSKQL